MTPRKLTRSVPFILAAAAIVSAQAPEFDAASVKPAPPGASERSFTQSPGRRLTTSNATLKMLIAFAYQLMPDQILGGPRWLESDGFDIEAKGAGPKVTQSQFRQMIQGLLADRFQLAVHRATKELPVYALVQARNGAKLVEAKPDNPEVSMRIEGPGRMTGVKATMPMLATALSRPLQRKVVDETGLNGAYTFQLHFAPEHNPPGPGADAAAPTDAPSIFTALQEQLGLGLKPGKGPVEVIVVDRAQKPAPN